MLNELRVLQHGSTGPVDEEEAELARWRTTVVHGNRTTSRELDLLDRQAILDRLHDWSWSVRSRVRTKASISRYR